MVEQCSLFLVEFWLGEGFLKCAHCLSPFAVTGVGLTKIG